MATTTWTAVKEVSVSIIKQSINCFLSEANMSYRCCFSEPGSSTIMFIIPNV